MRGSAAPEEGVIKFAVSHRREPLDARRYGELAAALAGSARRAYLIGEAAGELRAALEAAGVEHEESGDLETAVRSAAANARPGEIVLLAPACTSYDQFRDFEERGDTFRRLVGELGK